MLEELKEMQEGITLPLIIPKISERTTFNDIKEAIKKEILDEIVNRIETIKEYLEVNKKIQEELLEILRIKNV